MLMDGKKTNKIIDRKIFIILRMFSVAVAIGMIAFLYSLDPMNRLAIIVSYIIIAPLIAWLIKKAFRSANFDRLYIASQFISSLVLLAAIILLKNFEIIEFNNDLMIYLSTLLFAVLLYYIFGNDYTGKIYDVKKIRDSYAYSYFYISQNFDLYFIKTLIFVFYTFTLVFGHLRDLSIHSSDLFKYEQYAIILILAVDRIIIYFGKDYAKVKKYIRSKKDNEIEEFIQMFNDKLTEVKEQFELLLKINPEYDIERLDLWDNANDSEHPQTKLLYLYLMFYLFSEGNSDKIDELFILTGKSVSCALK